MPQAGPLLEAPIQLSKLLQIGVNDRPHEAALVSMEGVWSWSNLDQATNRLAAQYGARLAAGRPRGVAPAEPYRAVRPLPRLLKAGLVLTPLNYRYTPPEIDHALDVSAARIILAHAERAEDIAASKASSLPLGVIIYGDEAGKGLSFEALLKAEALPAALPEPGPNAPAAIFFTSGSTGPAKGVTHTHDRSAGSLPAPPWHSN